jgi:hypothetical protein
LKCISALKTIALKIKLDFDKVEKRAVEFLIRTARKIPYYCCMKRFYTSETSSLYTVNRLPLLHARKDHHGNATENQ